MNRVIDISKDGRHLSRVRGLLLVSEDHTEIARVPLDEIGATKSPIKTAIATICQSLVKSYSNRKPQLIFPDCPAPSELSALGAVDDIS